MQKLINLLASGFYISYLPALIIPFKKNTGAGFLGTLLAVPCVYMLWPKQAVWQSVLLVVFTLCSVWVCGRAKLPGAYQGHDNPKIVLDEIVGYFTAMWLLPHSWPYLLAAFVLFRTLDTLKPWPVSYFDRILNAWGVVLDDVAAGAVANILIQIFVILTHAGLL